MGDMADYYDDRSEDFTQLDEINPGYADTSIGRAPITAPRGGTKYPQRTYTNAERRKNAQEARKRNKVSMTPAEIRAELASNDGLAAKLVERRMQLEQMLANARPAEPGPGHDRFSVQVQFAPRAKKYEFLLLRSGRRWYTTGATEKTAVFYSWDQLVDWLTGDDVHWHSDLQRLALGNEAWDMKAGELVVNGMGESPF